MPEKVHRAVDGLGDLMDDYEFHYPGELNRDNLDDVRAALGGHGIYAIAGGPPRRCALQQGRPHEPRRLGAQRGAAASSSRLPISPATSARR